MDFTAVPPGSWSEWSKGRGLHWYALNYRIAATLEQAQKAFDALEKYVEGRIADAIQSEIDARERHR